VQHSIWVGNFVEKPRHGKVVVVEGVEQLKNVILEAYIAWLGAWSCKNHWKKKNSSFFLTFSFPVFIF
jgi:hypothetical protein